MSKDPSKSPIDNAYDNGEFEILSFRGQLDRGPNGYPTWLSHLMLEGMSLELINKLAAAPEWNGNRLAIGLQLNGVRVLFADFEKICSYFVKRSVEEKLQRANFDDFQKAVELTARGMLGRQQDSIQEKLGDLDNLLNQVKEQANAIVEREYAVPYLGQVNEKMMAAGLNALSRFFSAEDDLDFDGKATDPEPEKFRQEAVEAIWLAMYCARESRPVYEIQLPKAQTDGLSTRSQIREELMEEIKESLTAQGLIFKEAK